MYKRHALPQQLRKPSRPSSPLQLKVEEVEGREESMVARQWADVKPGYCTRARAPVPHPAVGPFDACALLPLEPASLAGWYGDARFRGRQHRHHTRVC